MKKSDKICRPVFHILLLLLEVLLVFSVFHMETARAQGLSQIKLSLPDTSKYPEMQMSFWPFDSDGNFINTITVDSLHVFENDREVDVTSLQLLEPGTHFVVAVNEGATLANAYSGKTRMDRMKEVWLAWAVDQSITTVDDFSLVTNENILADQLATPAEWVQAIEEYKPALKSATPTFNCLSLALDRLANITDDKTRAVLLITPLPESNQLTVIQDMASRAAANGIRLFIWLVGPQTYQTEGGAGILQQAADTTGGSLFIFSGAETLPPIATYLEPLRFEYQAVYKTSIQKSGRFTLAVQVDQTGYQESSEKVDFNLIVSPPNPIFLSPPSTITRSWVRDEETNKLTLIPSQQIIQLMVEFPDGHTRGLNAARLFVDNELVAENVSEPFNEFTWDLSPYQETGKHLLQIRIIDAAGISASTIEAPVVVVVNKKPLNFIQRFFDQVDLQNLGISLFLILVAAGLVVLFLRLRLRNPARQKMSLNDQRDPLRQSVFMDDADVISQTTKPQSRGSQSSKIPARLVVIGGPDCSLAPNTTFTLSTRGVLIGSDSIRCDIVVSGPTISPIHAEILCDAAQNFSIADRGSAAGSWINYAPVSTQGARLDHGDLIHIGACAFRFELTDARVRTIQAQPYREE